MYDQLSDPVRAKTIAAVMDIKAPMLGEAPDNSDSGYGELVGDLPQSTSTAVFAPVFESVAAERVIGSISIDFDWSAILTSVLPDASDGITCVIENSQGLQLTFKAETGSLVFQGAGDLHDKGYDEQIVESFYADFLNPTQSIALGQPSTTGQSSELHVSDSVYPSNEFKNNPLFQNFFSTYCDCVRFVPF